MSDLIEHVAEDALKVAVPEVGAVADVLPLVDAVAPVAEAPVAEAPVAEAEALTEDALAKAATDYAAPHIATLEESISSLPVEIMGAAKTALAKLKEMFTL